MLRLSHEQVDLVERLLLRRHAAGVALVLQEAWPAVTERLKERWGAFVEAALQQGHRHGIETPADLARYASLWCIWGAAFEDKPGLEWAREIVGDARRGPALKVHQLIHRSREELAKQQPRGPSAVPVVTPAQLDAALAKVEAGMSTQAAARALFLDVPPALPVKACDIGTIDLMVAESDGVQEYRLNGGIWQRVAAPKLGLPPLQWSHAPDEPLKLAMTSHPLRAGPPARLNIKLQPLAICDPRVHPELVHQTDAGRLSWKGRDTARLSLALYAKPAAAPDPKLGPHGIAAPSEPDLQQVQVASCGLRDAGAPFGDVAIELRVFPALQWLTEVRHAVMPALQLPGPPPAPAAPAAVCKLEADGTPRDASIWQRGWTDLQPQFRAGLEKLYNAWARPLEGSSARLEAQASPLAGQAALTWGWRRTGADQVAMRTEGQLDLLACALELRLSGEVALGAARARVQLATEGRCELRGPVEQLGDEAPEGRGLGAVKRTWRFPFTLEIDPLASGDLATLSAVPAAPGAYGGVAGECGLRPRPDGKGLQWYFQLRSEPVAVTLVAADPLLGTRRKQLVLLPAMTLVDWSAG